MSNHHLIVDAHTLANQQLERLRILLLSLSNSDDVRGMLPDCQVRELDGWMFDLVCQAQTHLEAAIEYAAQQRDIAVVPKET
ncbi:hypothetical protein CSC67_10555 [Pusillimonas caeni]|uniref:hypothetical protein n=1 Tax=Pusillimonas caeni TaxID=1348472 RepID=UPI000E59D689|nr:hypothetical protein [Pusillimonas caeni]TFL13692.1 hypothetical protein CSC67_10555 [Pusillimonas caeni]